ncbi:MAG: hypothetical protein IJV43_05560 [Oscillospiraceae bacterium]|nr:hypothetical protein [Oscillospiraceae bacterium]
MDTPRDIWSKLDDENVRLHRALNLLYAMNEAARSAELDHRRYADAMDFVWEHLCDIEKRYALLNEALGSATNEK